MTELPWDDLKVCFNTGDNLDRLWNAHQTGRLELPEGWELDETESNPAFACKVIFRVCVLPTPADAYKVKAELRRWTC